MLRLDGDGAVGAAFAGIGGASGDRLRDLTEVAHE